MSSKMKIEVVYKEGLARSIKMKILEADCQSILVDDKKALQNDSTDNIIVKVKFYRAADDQNGRTRVHFKRKVGDLVCWTHFFQKMRVTHLDDVLLLAREHME